MIEKTEKDSHPVKSGMVKSKVKRERTKPRKLKEGKTAGAVAEKSEIVEKKVRRERKVHTAPRGDKKEFAFKKENLKIIPLGGLQEIGKNMTVFEYGDEMIIVDCGLAFPEDDMLGVDLVIPDITYLEKNKYKINKTIMKNGLVKSKMLIHFLLPQESSKLIVIRA